MPKLRKTPNDWLRPSQVQETVGNSTTIGFNWEVAQGAIPPIGWICKAAGTVTWNDWEDNTHSLNMSVGERLDIQPKSITTGLTAQVILLY